MAVDLAPRRSCPLRLSASSSCDAHRGWRASFRARACCGSTRTRAGIVTRSSSFGRSASAFDLARSGDEADELLKALSYDVVVSNIKRIGAVDGLTSLATLQNELKQEGRHLPPVVWYVMSPDPVIDTSLALGITNRPDQLLHHVFDAIERTRS